MILQSGCSDLVEYHITKLRFDGWAYKQMGHLPLIVDFQG